MTVPAGVLIQIVLVIFVGGVEAVQRLEFDGQFRNSESGSDSRENNLQHSAVLIIIIICTRAEARAFVLALLVQAERVDNFEEQLGKPLQTHSRRVIDYMHALGVAGVVLIHLFVGGVVGMAVDETNFRPQHAVNKLEELLGAPEAARRKPYFFFHSALIESFTP